MNVDTTRLRFRRSTLLCGLLLCAVTLTGCGGSSTPAGQAAPQSSSSVSDGHRDHVTGSPTVTISNFSFSGRTSVKAGSTVLVTNRDGEAHTVTADGAGGFDVVVPPGKTVSFTAPDSGGTYRYHCSYHSDMHGTLRVR